jgi:hypothetical protein
VRGGGRRRRQRRGASYPLFEFIHRGLVEVSISLSGSGSSINFPIQLGLQLGPRGYSYL